MRQIISKVLENFKNVNENRSKTILDKKLYNSEIKLINQVNKRKNNYQLFKS